MDYKKYHQDWRDVIRPMILKRDQYKCRQCGIRHKTRVYRQSKGGYQICDEFIENWAKEQGKKVFTVFLQVAHIDQNKKNNKPENLMSLCPRCHSKFDKSYKDLLRITFGKQIEEAPTEPHRLVSLESTVLIGAISKKIYQYTGVSLTPNQVKTILVIIQNSNNHVN